MDLGISIIICCYNSAVRLPETLKHIAGQKVPGHIPWEVIVVDNASTDDTAQTASAEWAKNGVTDIPFYVVAEPTAGLRFAREKGISIAKYEYLLFCDDDNWLCDNYLATAYQIFENDEKIGVLGGCGIFEPEQPVWQGAEKYKSAYVNGPQTWAPAEHWVYGASSVYRKSALLNFQKHGWQQLATGRKGNQLIAAEDVEMCFMFFLNGYKIIADDRLLFKHFVALKRQNFDYIRNLKSRLSYSYVLLNNYIMLIDNDKRAVQKKLNGWLSGTLKVYVKLSFKLWRQRLLSFKPPAEEQQIKMGEYWGTIQSIMQNRKKIIAHYKQLTEVLKATGKQA